jgi:hypothetical protein
MNKTDIANLALQYLGAAPITSLDENSKEASIIKQVFSSNVNSLLQEHNWNFAIKRVTLSPLVEKPVYEYEYLFKKPSDCLRVIKIEPIEYEFTIEGENILTNTDKISLKYVSLVDNASLFSPMFAELLAIKIATNVSYSIISNATLNSNLFEIYQRKLVVARSMDAKEGTPEKVGIYGNTWLDARL